MLPDSGGLEYRVDINSTILSQSSNIPYTLFCNTTHQGGFVSSEFIVNAYGLPPPNFNSYGLIFLPLFMALLFLFIATKLDGNDVVTEMIFLSLVDLGLWMITLATYIGYATSIVTNNGALLNTTLSMFRVSMWVSIIMSIIIAIQLVGNALGYFGGARRR